MRYKFVVIIYYCIYVKYRAESNINHFNHILFKFQVKRIIILFILVILVIKFVEIIEKPCIGT